VPSFLALQHPNWRIQSHIHHETQLQRRSPKTFSYLTSHSFLPQAVGPYALHRSESPHPRDQLAPSATSPSPFIGTILRSGAPTAKLESPPPKSSTLHVQRKRSNTDNLRERSVSVRISQARGDEDDTLHGGTSSPIEMLLGKGYTWKSAKTRFSPSRQLVTAVRNPRFLLSFGLFTLFIVLWQSLSSAAGDVQRYVVCQVEASAVVHSCRGRVEEMEALALASC
jgi:hypothetical protein